MSPKAQRGAGGMGKLCFEKEGVGCAVEKLVLCWGRRVGKAELL